MINRIFFFWILSPMKREAAFSVVAYDNYQYLHQAASRCMGGMQSNLIVFGISYCGWWLPEVGHAFVYIIIIPIGYVFMFWLGGCILSNHAGMILSFLYWKFHNNKGLSCVWISFLVNDLRWSQQHIQHKEESLEVREGIFLLLNCSIHGVLPLCMNGQY